MPILPGQSEAVSVTITTSASTPFGSQNVTVRGTDGFVVAAATFKMGIGDFSLSINPTTIVVGPTGSFTATMSSSSTYGLNEGLSFICNGLPAGAACGLQTTLYTSGPSAAFIFNSNQLAANDYPLQIVGTADIVSHTVDAILRVGDFTASLDKTAATLSGGQSATFNVTLTSINHYTSSITVFCEPPVNTLTCSVSPSPATLTDGGTTPVQLKVTYTAAAQGNRHVAWRSSSTGFLLVSLVLLCFGGIRRKARPMLDLFAVAALATMISCGGGSNGSSPAPPPPPPQTVTISVVAQAASTQSDSGNQKTLAPIVITLN
jgi:hypothetical protein